MRWRVKKRVGRRRRRWRRWAEVEVQFCSVNPGVGPGPCITLHRNSLFHVSLPVRVFCPPRQTFIPRRRRRRRRQFSCKRSETQDVRKIFSLSLFTCYPPFSCCLFISSASSSLSRPFRSLCTFFVSTGVRVRSWRSTGVLEIPFAGGRKQGRTIESAPSSIPPARDFSSMKFRLFRVKVERVTSPGKKKTRGE